MKQREAQLLAQLQGNNKSSVENTTTTILSDSKNVDPIDFAVQELTEKIAQVQLTSRKKAAIPSNKNDTNKRQTILLNEQEGLAALDKAYQYEQELQAKRAQFEFAPSTTTKVSKQDEEEAVEDKDDDEEVDWENVD